MSAGIDANVRVALGGLATDAGLHRLDRRLDALGVSLPMLHRQYVGLVEPDGVQFQGFGEDSGFAW